MTDDELRALVRESIARHVGTGAPGTGVGPHRSDIRPESHPSYGLLPLLRGSDGDGACLIEPAVRCSHCGYCLSYGH